MIQAISRLKPDVILPVEMSSGFYSRIQALTSYLIEDKAPEQIQAALDQIESDTIQDAWVFHFETLLILCKEFESNAESQGFIESVDIEIADEDSEEPV